MPEVLLPNDNVLADIDRRLRTLEATQRVGLNRIRYAWSTVDTTATVYGAFTFGPAAAQWQDDQGNTGTGYPTLTGVQTGRKALFFAQTYVTSLAFDPTFRSSQASIGIASNPVFPTSNPVLLRSQTHGPTTEGQGPLQVIGARADLTPSNSAIFQVYALFEDRVPGAVNLPSLTTTVLVVIPLD